MGVNKLFLIFIFVCKVAESDSFVMSVRLTWAATEQVFMKFYIKGEHLAKCMDEIHL